MCMLVMTVMRIRFLAGEQHDAEVDEAYAECYGDASHDADDDNEHTDAYAADKSLQERWGQSRVGQRYNDHRAEAEADEDEEDASCSCSLSVKSPVPEYLEFAIKIKGSH